MAKQWLAIIMFAAAFGSFIFSADATPGAPGIINYQGRLLDLAGAPITHQVTITFTFYDAATGGNALGDGATPFSDADDVTPNEQGIYSTNVGDDPDNLIPTTVFDQDTVYLNVAIDGENLTPRTRITASAYAMNLNNVRSFKAAEAISAGDFVLGDSNGNIRRRHTGGESTDIGTDYPCGSVEVTVLDAQSALINCDGQLMVAKIAPDKSISPKTSVLFATSATRRVQGLRSRGKAKIG